MGALGHRRARRTPSAAPPR